jgi:malonate-semialdehyde dehydrogenase (acetylating) / methylmalonate-semialdehyde dehydrogenase
MPDADMEMSVRMIADLAFGCAGQRCLAASIAISVGEARATFTPAMLETAATRRVGYGLDPEVEIGPVVTSASRARIEQLIAAGEREGDRVLVDGRGARVSGYEQGHFVKPTVLELARPGGAIGATEVFGPVLSLRPLDSLEEAIAAVNASAFGNMACIFTSSGALARQFRYETRVGNVGVNVNRRADGVLSVLRVETELLWRPSRTRTRRRGVLHGKEGCRRALAETVVAHVLMGSLLEASR